MATATSSSTGPPRFKRDTTEMNDWNKPGDLADFISVYEGWRFDWLDVAELIRKSEFIFEYPMVDKDPLRALDLRPRDARGRCRAPDVSARLERLGAERDRCAHARRLSRGRAAIRATR